MQSIRKFNKLSKLIHKLQRKNIDYNLSWKVLVNKNRPRQGKGALENTFYLQADSGLNKNETMINCIHKNRFLWTNIKEK